MNKKQLIVAWVMGIFLLSGCTNMDYANNMSNESDKIEKSLGIVKDSKNKEYFQGIRDKIKTTVHKYYSANPKQGIVYLRIHLLQNGKVKNLKVYKDKTKASAEVIKLALEAVKKASPFKPFPNNLKQYPELYFDIRLVFGK
jgi:TonB family protein